MHLLSTSPFVEILARTGNKVKPIRENETEKHSSLAGVRNTYQTQTYHSPRDPLREGKLFQPLVKKRPLYIQNTNVRYSDMHKRDMYEITDPYEYSKHRVNHIQSCNIYVHFMRKEIIRTVQITRWIYAMQDLRNLSNGPNLRIGWVWSNDRSNLSMIERIEFTDWMSMIERIIRELFIFNLLMQQT